MSKIVKNTTGSDIEVAAAGITLVASSSYTIDVSDYTLWASDAVIDEITTAINAGDIVINDTVDDLSAARGLDYLKYPHRAFHVRFDAEPERSNCFVSKTVQEAIEEARAGTAPISATTTVNATPTVAFSETLDDDTVYIFDARVTAEGQSSSLHGGFQQEVTVRRRSAGVATIVGDIYQKMAQRDALAAGIEICWDVSGNAVQLKVTGLAATTIEWFPQVELIKKCI